MIRILDNPKVMWVVDERTLCWRRVAIVEIREHEGQPVWYRDDRHIIHFPGEVFETAGEAIADVRHRLEHNIEEHRRLLRLSETALYEFNVAYRPQEVKDGSCIKLQETETVDTERRGASEAGVSA